MSKLTTLVLLGLLTTIHAKPGQTNEMSDADSDTDIIKLLVEEIAILRRDQASTSAEMGSMSQKHETDMISMSSEMVSMSAKMASMTAEMALMSQKHETEINAVTNELHKAQEQIGMLKEMVNQPDRDSQKTPETGADSKTGDGESLPKADMVQTSLKNIDSNNATLQPSSSHIDKALTAGVTAFYARIAGFTGSPTEYSPIPFDLVDLNIGGAYDAPSGLFTAPVAGIYSLSYDVMADNSCGTGNICAALEINGIIISGSCSEYAASGGAAINVQLVAGDTAWVSTNHGSPCQILQSSSLHNKFSGHLVYQTI